MVGQGANGSLLRHSFQLWMRMQLKVAPTGTNREKNQPGVAAAMAAQVLAVQQESAR